jgi:hypothetical protein
MIVFRRNGEFVLNTDIPSNPLPYEEPTFVETVPVGYLNVYLIANELPTWNLASVNTEAQLDTIIYNYYTYSGYTTQLPEADGTHHVPMFGMHKGIYVSSSGNTDLTSPNPNPPTPAPYPITVERIFAKVTLKLNCVFADQTNGGSAVELKNITLKQVPKHSYLSAQRYFGSDFNDYPAFYTNPALPPPTLPTNWPSSTYVETTTGFQDSLTFYLPEYLLSDTTKYTYLSIKVNVKGSLSLDKEYKIVLGEGLVHSNKYMLGDSIVDGHRRDILDLSILRNTHYVIGGRITNLSLTGDQDLGVKLVVVDWDDTKVIDPWDIGDYSITISQSDFQVPTTSLPFTGVVTIETDYNRGWSASSSNPSMVTLNGSVTNQFGPLRFTVNNGATGTTYIDVTVGKITKRIRIVVS